MLDFTQKDSFFRSLETMRADNRNSKPPFFASKYWEEVNALFNKEFEKAEFGGDGIVNLRESGINRRLGGLGVGNRKIFEMYLFLYYKRLSDRDTFGIMDRISEPDGSMDEVLKLQDRTLSVDLLFAADNILTIAEVRPEILTHEMVVAELGAGWGCNGYLLRHLNPKIHYLVFDLPESLAVIQTYLPRFRKQDAIRYYDSRPGAMTRADLEKYDLAFYGAHHLEDVADNTIDLFINVASFQEMTIEHITQYFHLIDKKVNGLLYTKNYVNWTNPDDNADTSLKNYPWMDNWNQKILRQADNFHNNFVAVFEI